MASWKELMHRLAPRSREAPYWLPFFTLPRTVPIVSATVIGPDGSTTSGPNTSERSGANSGTAAITNTTGMRPRIIGKATAKSPCR